MPRLEKLDRNKDGKLSSDEYGEDPILNNVGKNAGNRDGVVSEDEWDLFAKKVVGPNALLAVRIEKNGARELWRYDKNFTSVIPSHAGLRQDSVIVRNGGILTAHSAATGEVLKTGRLAGALGGYSSSPVAAEGRSGLRAKKVKFQ